MAKQLSQQEITSITKMEVSLLRVAVGKPYIFFLHADFFKRNDMQLYLHSNSRIIKIKLKLFIITRGIFVSQLSVLNSGCLKFSFLL